MNINYKKIITIVLILIVFFTLNNNYIKADGMNPNDSDFSETPTNENTTQIIQPPKASKDIPKKTAFKLGVDYLSDIIGFEVAIIAFLIPLSFDIISRLSERYNSNILVKTFEKEHEYCYLSSFLLFNIFLGLILRFRISDPNNIGHLETVLMWFFFILGLASCIWLFIFLLKLKKYSEGTNYVKNKLFEKIKKILK